MTQWSSTGKLLNNCKEKSKAFSSHALKLWTSTAYQKAKTITDNDKTAGITLFNQQELVRYILLPKDVTIPSGDDDDDAKDIFFGNASNNSKLFRPASIGSEAAVGFVAQIIKANLLKAIPDDIKDKLYVGHNTFKVEDCPDEHLKTLLDDFDPSDDLTCILLPPVIAINYQTDLFHGKLTEETMAIINSICSPLEIMWYKSMTTFKQSVHDHLVKEGAAVLNKLAAEGFAKSKTRGMSFSPYGLIRLDYLNEDNEAGIPNEDIAGKHQLSSSHILLQQY